MASYVITGASRGLGLELTRQLSARSEVGKIFATARGDSPKLQELAKASSGRIVVIKLDVSDEAAVKKAAAEVEIGLAGKGLDVLINNAGIRQFSQKGTSSMENLQESFTTNVLGVHWVTRAFIPLLQKGNQKKIANISSTVGSITYARLVQPIPAPAYKITKTAVNALTVQYALDYENEGFTIFALSPGWLRTDLGGEQADLSVEDGAEATLVKILSSTKEQNGQFLNIKAEGWGEKYDGSNAPW
ncbi:short chain dehydrogenase reductase [Talaromyces proteolyticus]|uniref:Short chain dehydrogenase reductase n=1 Tax=Talaromyces proteolyticus TaxID=1131652 RepID=A0AAD4PYT0_9EURO|nr:short chain dehydrogenase reductase [Talaromyces proteolyticus]KAH8701855.1 short chain dehydrogenase reductase [Talaromyces proteolyticus]